MMLYYIISEGVADDKFIDERCEDYEGFKANILKLNMDNHAEITGVDKNLQYFYFYFEVQCDWCRECIRDIGLDLQLYAWSTINHKML